MKNLLCASILSGVITLTGCTENEKKFTIELLTAQTSKKCEETLFWEKCEEEEEQWIIEIVAINVINKKIDNYTNVKNLNTK